MKRVNNGKGRFGKFLYSNGVYISIAVALLALGGLGISRILDTPKKEPMLEPSNHEMVEQNVTGQRDDRTESTTAEQTTTTEAPKTTQTEEVEQEYYVFPLSNTVQKAFSDKAPVYSETMDRWSLHLGTDFAGEAEQEVKAITRGTVTKVEQDPLWGDVIEMDHSLGVVSRYCGVKATVKKGDTVEVGDVIGVLTEVPCESSQKTHLHLEMTIDGVPIDAVEAIGAEVRYADTLTE
ncbi:MAG: M23 family metallopeptidase [Ruminococcaceae bacterium]|nr:M23 family metallopeptidase [Oscillospiraceae bacterium]